MSKVKTTKKKESTANRGMDLEKKLSKKFKKYYDDGIACIFKVPTDWVAIRKGAKIVTAYPKQKSIVDYLGAYKNIPIAVEAKRTTNKTSFPFNNVHDHQWEFFDKFCEHGKGYYVIWFKTLEECYLVEAKEFHTLKDTIDRKSAPIDWFRDNCTLLDNKLNILEHIK